uniref:Ig-like domain-containing protein n=1 Tax=Neogobius melanostomus TaxID=47308 RepID=A0A8C6WI11_9GOBI
LCHIYDAFLTLYVAFLLLFCCVFILIYALFLTLFCRFSQEALDLGNVELEKMCSVQVGVKRFHLYELRAQYWLYFNRTSLSEHLSRGDASLLISQVSLKDQGTFRCSTVSSRGQQRHSLELTVFAPVLEVFVYLNGQQLLCVSEGIYPEPSVVWTPSTEDSTRVTKSEQGLFSVISSVIVSDSEDKHICNISTAHSWRRAAVSIKKQTSNFVPNYFNFRKTKICTLHIIPIGGAIAPNLNFSK